MAENAERNLRLFQELISCSHNLYFWTFDTRMECVHTTCPESRLLKLIFTLDETQSAAISELQNKQNPIVLSNPLGLLWIMDFELDSEGNILYTHVIGPTFVEDVSFQTLEQELNRMGLSLPMKQDFLALLKQLPVMPFTRFFDYGVMMHYCITGEKITIDCFQYPRKKLRKQSEHTAVETTHATWAMEQRLMKLVEEGNLNFREESGKMVSTGNIAYLGNGDMIRHMKNLTIIFTALCTRAAIRGGLDSEIAYTLSDQYINSIEACDDLAEIAEINTLMSDDFVKRVHQIKSRTDISIQIQNCCSYIQVHITEKITTAALAQYIGYSETYLSRKFSKEMGMTISEYIMSQKIECAKILLSSGKESVQDISDHLGFHSQSYFGEQFRKATGTTPGKFRSQMAKESKEKA